MPQPDETVVRANPADVLQRFIEKQMDPDYPTNQPQPQEQAA